MAGRLPNVPDPTVIAGAGVEAIKGVMKGGVGVGTDIAVGIEQILFNTIEGGVNSLKEGASSVVRIVRNDVQSGKTSVEKILSEIDRAGNNVISQVDRGIGQEVVRKFKSEVERLLR